MTVNLQRLSQFPIFSTMSGELLQQAGSFCQFKTFPKGRFIFQQGEVPKYFYLVEQGMIKVYLDTSDGREYILHLVESGQSFAEAAVFSMPQYPANAMALTDCETIAVPRAEINQMIETDSVAAKAMITGQSMWLRRLVSLTSLLALDNIATRLARFIIEHAQSQQIQLRDGTHFSLGMKKSILASRIGTIPETLSRNLARIEQEGAIVRQGKSIKIKNYETLKKIAFPEF
ncbi:Crp/Fnr family transcriptional regulator [candidate division CSSED10-310 bacterium]|uniref:Crp/Fnr family transcriptional regulator n=1 Tax=candidate division CSSED10-310 bacterium TaxID=2855610 RepID=A0ABV6Z0Q7_UNCC1